MNIGSPIPIITNHDNEPVTLIAVPLQLFQQATQQQSFIVEQNVLFNTLPDGTIVIDTNQLLNNDNNCDITTTTDVNSNNENSDFILTVQQKDDNLITNESNISNTNNATKKEEKNTSKIRYLNNKTLDIRKVGRPKKDISKLNNSDPENKGPFICKYCKKEFDKWLIFKRHEKSHMNEKKYKCSLCPSSFNILINHVLHIATHNTDDPKCPECGKKFQRIASLKAHIMYHEKEETFYCEDCDILFDNDVEMNEHIKTHGQEKEKKERIDNLKCKYCQLTFTEQSSFKKHMMEHNKMRHILQSPIRKKPKRSGTIERKHQCNSCSKAFQKRSQIERHMRVHTGEKPFVCKICNKGFSQKGSLQIHMSRHTGNKPHKCTLCQAKFTQKGNLRAHILKTHSVPHEGENVYCCTECSCVFKRLGSLNGHITRNHPKDKNNDLKYVLSQLSAIQSSMSNIDNDILQQAINKSDIPGQNIEEPPDSPSAIYVTLAGSGLDGNMRRYVIKQRKVGDIRWHLCSLCPKEFKKPSDLVRHIRVHTREKPFMCKYCGRSFAIKSTLTTHMKTHMKLTKVECKYCHKFFSSWNSLNAHMLKHTAPKQKCQVCNKSYRSKSQLNQHCKNHSAESSAYYKEPNSNTIMLQPIQITSRGLEPVSSLRKRPILEAGCKSRPHTCKVCSGAFRKLSHLKQHYLLKHTEERPYTCYHCFRNFGSSSNLYTHIATHTGMRPYSCSVCKKDFTTNGSLKRHMVTHNLDKPFICPICFLDFKTLPQCKKHIETHAPSDINIHMETDDNVDTNELVDTETNLTYNSNIDNNLVNSYTVVQPLNNTNLEEIPKNVTDKIENSTSLLSSSVKENNSVILSVKQQNLPQGNINEIEDTLNSQMLNIIGSENFVDSSTYVNKLDVSQPIATTDELVNTLTGSAEPQKNIVDNSYLYQQVIVNLNPDPEQIPIFDNNGLDNIVTQLRLQNESLFLTDLNSLNMNETNNVLLPFQIAQQPEIQQNQLIMLPTEFEQEIHTTPIQNTVNLETIDTSLQLKLNNMNRILNSVPNITDPNIVINTTPIQTENEFLNVQNIEENIISTPITQISSLSGKNIENNVLTEVLCNQKQNSLLINNEKTSETVYIVCNMCKQNFKTKNELKCHQCINYINIEIANSNINNKNKTKPINSQNNEEGVVNLNIQLENSNRTEVVDNGEMDILNVKDKNITPKEFQEFVARKTKIDSQKTNESVDPKVKHRNQCPYCPKSFRKPSDLQRHIRTHTGERPFKCTECDKKFSLKSTLDSHNKIHQGKKEYVCMVCNCFFATNGSLTVHMRLHTGVKPFKCPLCSLKFRTSGHRKAHLTVHYKEVLKTGKISSDGVARKTKMSELMKKVENMINSNINEEQNNKDDNEIEFNLQNIPLDQELPLESFVETSLELQADDKQSNMHYEIETNTEGQITNIKPTASNILFIDETSKKEVVSTQVDFDDKTKLQIENFLRDKKDKISESKNKIKKVCNICHKEFSSKYLLDRHSKIHTGERIFSCDYCSKSFNQKNTLQIHKRTHSGTRPYSCPHCANTFSQIGNLKTHIKRIHSHIEQSQQNTDTLCSGFIINDITENLPT